MAKKAAAHSLGPLCTRSPRETALEGSSAALSSPKCGVFQWTLSKMSQQAVERQTPPREQAGMKKAFSYTLHYPGQFLTAAPPLHGPSAAKLGYTKPSKVTQTHPGAEPEPARRRAKQETHAQ